MAHFKKAICNDTFKDREYAHVLHYIGELGYDGVEINPYTLQAFRKGLSERGTAGADAPAVQVVEEISAAQLSEFRRTAQSAGLEIVGFHSIFRTPADFFYLNHPDASIRARTAKHLDALIRLCGDLGGKIMVLGASKQRNVHPDITFRQAWDYTVEVFQEVLGTAEKQGILLCLEPLSNRLTNFITTAADALRMVEGIHHPNFRMMLDVRSASDDEMPIPELIRLSARYLAHFHANDDNARGPGMGNADYGGISAALREIGYHGYLSVEVFDFQPDPETIARESLETLRRYFD